MPPPSSAPAAIVPSTAIPTGTPWVSWPPRIIAQSASIEPIGTMNVPSRNAKSGSTSCPTGTCICASGATRASQKKTWLPVHIARAGATVFNT